MSRLPVPVLIVLGIVGVVDLYWLLVIRDFPALDARIWYFPSDVAPFLASLGEDGRHAYFIQELVADLSWMAVYTLLLLNVASRAGVRTLWPFLLPVTFDLVETLGILALLALWPDLPGPLVWTVAIATPLKWASLVECVVLIARSASRQAALK